MNQFILYGTLGCHLCDEAEALLQPLLVEYPREIECIDAVVAESLLTSPDSRERSNRYRWNPPSDIAAQLALLRPVVQRPLHVPVLSLDYWCPDDGATIREIYVRERLLGHYPYVATRALDMIIPEP